MRGNTEGLNTKTSVSSRKYPPVRVIANTRLCVMSRTVGVVCVDVWRRCTVCRCVALTEGNERARESVGVGGGDDDDVDDGGDGGSGSGSERVLVVVPYYGPISPSRSLV